MSFRQNAIKFIYPAFIRLNKLAGRQRDRLTGEEETRPAVDFYTLTVELIDGSHLKMSSFRGKKVLIVNTASDCGYTPQYKQLQQLSERYSNRLAIIGFPANDFKHQEKGSDEAIAAFCKRNYGVSFTLARKSVVVKEPGQNAVFNWLTHANMNGWNDHPPTWNFSKYLVDENGSLNRFFGSSVEPLDAEIIRAIESTK